VTVERLQIIDEDAPAAPDTTVWSPVEISVQAFRGVQAVTLDVSAVVTLLTGANGAGKTSVLEAMEFLHTGAVLSEAGKRLNQSEYLPDDGGDPAIMVRYKDLAGVRQGPNEDYSHVVRRTLDPHRVSVNAWEGGAKDADLQLYRAMELDVERLPTLMQADRFPRLSQSEQADFLADWVRGGKRQVNLAAHAQDDLQRSIAEEIAKRVQGFGADDAFDVALQVIGERRTAAHRAVKQAEEDLANAQGALEEALAEVREAGYDTEDLEVLEGMAQADAVATREVLEDTRNKLQARNEAEASIARWREQSQQAQADLAAAQEELAGADARAAALREKREQAEARVREAREAHEAAQARQNTTELAVGSATEAKRDAQREHDAAASRLKQLRDLAETGCCPTCTRPTDADFDEIIADAEAEEAQAAQKLGTATAQEAEARKADDAAREELREGERALEVAREDLASIPAPPDADAIRTRVDTLQARIDTLAEQSEAARETVAQYPDDLAETVETLQDALAQHRATTETLRRARDHQERVEDLAQQVEAHKAERLACDRLKSAWQDAQSTSMSGNPELEALLDEVNAILMPTRNWQAGWSQDGPVVIGPGFTRELTRLSDGERLTVGAAWQAAMARRVGLGLCCIDHAAEIDDETFAEFVTACYEIGEITGVRFLIARPDAGYVRDDAQIVTLRNGRIV
jgi:ABC-type cobalamin/Fe3+-siderophores transport system ATPase subunit